MHRTHAAIQRKFAQKNHAVERLAEKCSEASENAQRHRQIERRAFLAHVGGSQVDGDAMGRGKIVSAILQRRFDPLAAFLDGDIGQAHNVELAHLGRADIHLDFHEVRFDAEDGGAKRFEEHG